MSEINADWQIADLQVKLAEAREFINKYGEVRNECDKTTKHSLSLELDAMYLKIKEKGDEN